MGIDIEGNYKRYGPMVLRRCRFLLKDEEAALDAVQEVFVKLLRYKDKLNGDYPSSLLYRMATNICLNMIRTENRKPQFEGEEILLKIAAFDEMEDRMIINDLLDCIFEKEQKSTREIAVMHYVDGMTLQEVADESGLSVSGVRNRLLKLRAKVKQIREIEYGREKSI